jgi:hypothetical protein
VAKRISVEDHPDLGIGYAVISIAASGLTEDIGLYIGRHGHEKADLGPAGWQSGEHGHQPQQVQLDDSGVELTVGPDIVGYMETANYRLELRDSGGVQQFSGVLSWRNVTPCAPPGARDATAAGLDAQAATIQAETRHEDKSEKEAEKEEEKEEDDGTGEEELAPGPGPGPGEEPPPPGGRRRIIVVVVLLLLLFVGGWLLWSLLSPPTGDTGTPAGEPPVTEEQLPEEPDAPETESAPPEQPEAEPEQPEEQAPPPPAAFDRREWLERSPEDQLARGREFLDETASSDQAPKLVAYAEWLFDMAKDQGSAEAALELARLYDPRELSPQRSRQLPPDLNSAYRAYRQAGDLGSGAAEAALCELKSVVDQAASEGDGDARMLLRRPWPGC